ncbi:MAG: hypothetical protein WCK86_22415, partial [Planctomycetia bacterium]
MTSPWIITVDSANTDSAGVYRQFAVIYSVQSYVGAVARRDDTRVVQRFYRVADELGQYLFHDDGDPATADAPVLVEKVTAAGLIDGNQIQFLALQPSELRAGHDAVLWYGNDGIVISTDDTAETIRTRMESQLPGVTSVKVLGSGTETDPWSFEFITAVQTNGRYGKLELSSGGGSLSTTAVVTRSVFAATEVTPATNDRQFLRIPLNASQITLSYNGLTTAAIDILSLDAAQTTSSGAAAAVELAVRTALEGLSSVSTVSVIRGTTADAPWVISVISADKDTAGHFYSLQCSVTRSMSAAVAATLPTASDTTVQTINFGSSDRSTLSYDQMRMLVDSSTTAQQFQDSLTEHLGGGTVAVTGQFPNWTFTFTPLAGGPSPARLLFSSESVLTTSVAVPATFGTPANRLQTLTLPASAATIFYGNSGIDINTASVTSTMLKEKLEALSEITRVEVTGQGTVASPWELTIVAATVDANGDFLLLGSQAFSQSGSVIQSTQGQSTTGQFSYQRTLKSTSSATQSILLPDWQTYATVHYGNDSVDLIRGMTAAEVEAALESLDSIRDVWVVGSGRNLLSSRQSLAAASIAEGMVFRFGSLNVTLAQTDLSTTMTDQATNLQARLRTLAGLSTVTVVYVSASDNFQITYPNGTTQLSWKAADAFVAATPDANSALQLQSLPSSAIVAGTAFRYGTATVTLARSDIGTTSLQIAARLQAKLRTLAGMSNVTVAYVSASADYQVTFPTAGATELSYRLVGPFTETTPELVLTDDPWKIAILDADRDQYENFLILETAVAVQKMKRSLTVSTAYTAATQRIPATAIVADTQFLYTPPGASANVLSLSAGDISTNTTTMAATLQSKLQSLGGGFTYATVSYSSVGGNYYDVTFPQSLPVSYTVTGGSSTTADSDPVVGLDLQTVPESAIAVGTVFAYNGVTVTLQSADIASGPE